MTPDQLKFHKLERIRRVLVLVSLQCALHDIIVLGTQLMVRTFRRDRGGEGSQEVVVRWKVSDNEG